MSVRKDLLHGVFWSAIEKYSGLIISLIVSSILARLISPEDFGIISIATVIINFLSLFTDLGIGPAIIQNKNLTKKDLDSIFTFTLLGGILLSILFFFSANFISKFYNNQSLFLVIRLLSLQLLFAALNIVPHAEMAKHKEFKKIATRTLLLQIITGGISCVVAYNTKSLYSLLISPIVTVVGIFLYNMHFYPKSIDWSLNFKPLKKIYSFSLYQFLFGFVNYFSRNIDNLLIGKFFNLSQLGFYDKAYRLMLLPLQNVSNVVNPVLQPILSEYQSNLVQLRMEYEKILKLLVLISIPLSIFLYFSAPALIHLFYGKNWDESIPIFQIFTITLSFQMILSTSGAIYQSANATKLLFLNGILNTFITIVSFVIANLYFRTLVSVAWAWNISLCINFFTSYFILFHKVLKFNIFPVLKLFVRPFILGVFQCFILYRITYCYIGSVLSVIFLNFLIVAITSLVFIHLFKIYDLRTMIVLIKNKIIKK